MSNVDLLSYPRKYRPKRIEEYIGNPQLKKSVLSSLSTDIKPQVLALFGPSGNGKTTMARLIAKEYNCENRDIEKGACGVCYNCLAMDEYIEKGTSDVLLNLKEVDATESSGKGSIIDILEDASLPAFDGNWKVFIIDECHQLSTAAQNVLLKPLEEPPEKVLIIMCTTNPEKLKDTIKGRFQYTFKVKKPKKEELLELLVRVCKSEGVLWEKRALTLIIAHENFVPRNSLALLERVVREVKEVTYDNTLNLLELIADTYFFDFYDILTSKFVDTHRYVNFIGKVKDKNEFKFFVESLINFTMRGIYVSNGVIVEALDVNELKQYKKLFSKFSVLELSAILEKLTDIKSSSDIELKLLTLGYTGLFNKIKEESISKLNIVDSENHTATSENSHGENVYKEKNELTAAEKEKILEDIKRPIGISDIARQYGGTIVK